MPLVNERDEVAHRTKHLRRNWVPDRLRKAEERKALEDKRQADDAARKRESQ